MTLEDRTPASGKGGGSEEINRNRVGVHQDNSHPPRFQHPHDDDWQHIGAVAASVVRKLTKCNGFEPPEREAAE